MSVLRLEVDGRTLEVDPPRVLLVGRAVGADVLLAGDSVSRHHAELRPTDEGWVLVDVGSAHGTFVDDQRVSETVLVGTTTVRCGPPGPGSSFTVEALGRDESAPAVTEVTPASPAERSGPELDHTELDHTELDHTVVLAPAARAGTGDSGPVPRSGPDLLVVAEGREHRFVHPANVTIGRLLDSSVVLTDPVASRQHGRIDAVPGGWTYANVSHEGTFVDGRRVDHQVVKERVALRLGHPVAGPEVLAVPLLSAHEEEQRIARARRGRRLVVAAAVLAALAVVVATTSAVLLVGGDGGPGGSAPGASSPSADLLGDAELDRAKVATVLIGASSVGTDGKRVTWSGSGSIIGSDGLILTNAHVAEPEAEGLEQQYGPTQDTNPDYLEIALVQDPTDSAAAPAYRARVVASDGYMDASVIQIYATIDGSELDGPLDLPTIPVGDSDDLRTGDDVTVLGFPGISGSRGVSVTRGVISTFLDDERLGPRSEIDTDARIAPGNSGGAAINNDAEIVGIPSATFSQEGSSVVSGRIRAINVVKTLIAQAEG